MLQAVRKCAGNAITISRIGNFVSVLVCLDLCLCRLTTQRLLFVSHWKHIRLHLSNPVPEDFLRLPNILLCRSSICSGAVFKDIVAIMADSLVVQGRDEACRTKLQ